MTEYDDIAILAKQLAELTTEVASLTKKVEALVTKNVQSDAIAVEQQERIDHAAQQLLEVSGRIEDAAHALQSKI